MIALAHPAWEVLRHLSAEQFGELLGRWPAVTRSIATVLAGLWRTSDVDKTAMIVRSGVDSSTWNAYAAAYNSARPAWIACLHAAGLTSLLDDAWPGKTMRVMAADLAWWHEQTGGGPHPDTACGRACRCRGRCSTAPRRARVRTSRTHASRRAWTRSAPAGPRLASTA
ncbi:hypothetical protein ACIRG5_17470 [Lentzea sp. NPDC102401]|uniref:hypothetical protein n=1 Tax=Lentzea sp. NPDC102401 TaxID=3364128 RepID=UPI00382AF38A